MTETQKVDMLSKMIGDEEDDEAVLSVYLQLAGEKILNRMYPFKEDYTGLVVPDRYAGVQLKVACYLLAKRGAEGQIQHIENGIHRNWGDSDIPDNMLKDVVPYCQAIR